MATSTHTAPSTAIARIKIEKDGTIIVFHGAGEMGQGCNTVALQEKQSLPYEIGDVHQLIS